MKNTDKRDIQTIDKIITLIYHICETNDVDYNIKQTKIKLPYYKYISSDINNMDFYDKEFIMPLAFIPNLIRKLNKRGVINDLLTLYDFIFNYHLDKASIYKYISIWGEAKEKSEIKMNQIKFDKKLTILNDMYQKYTEDEDEK